MVEAELHDPGAAPNATSRRAYRRAAALMVLGLLLLVGMWSIRPLVTGWPSTEQTPSGSATTDTDRDAVFCFGLVDFEQGTVALAPLQPGRVTEVPVRENTHVAAGAVLVRLDDRPARAKLAAAAAAVSAARALLTQAQQQPQRLRAQITQQQATLDAAGHRLSAARQLLARKRRLLEQKLLPAEEVASAEEEIRALEATQRAEQARLGELQLQNPTGEVQRAQAELDSARAHFRQAKLAVKECTLKAPGPGVVLRLHVQPGEVLDGRSNRPAVLFGPDGRQVIRAEVDQEFARGLREGQKVQAEDDVRPEREWQGKVQHLSNWYLPRREVLEQNLYVRDTRTLECLIVLDPDQPPLRIGQRMRVTIRR